MALRRFPSAQSTPTLASSKSDFAAKYGFHHLLDSPLPSPALPSIVPRHGKKPTPRRFRKWLRHFVRLSMWACGLCLVYWLVGTLIWGSTPAAAISYLTVGGEVYNMAVDEDLPQEPATVLVLDNKGRPKWTVSIPPRLDLPLRPNEYATICHQSDHISQHFRERNGISNHAQSKGSYDHDSRFMDVAEAEEHGLLPSAKHGNMDLKKRSEGREDRPNNGMDTETRGEVCERSLTYVLESSDAGFGITLMGLWMSYGLAKKEGRAFFIDDTNWYATCFIDYLVCTDESRAYGKYITFFQPPPIPSCLPPQPNHRLPCPHQTRHLLVSASTAPWTFGDGFNQKFQDSHKADILQQKPIFSLLRAGHNALFHLSKPDADSLSYRLSELKTLISAKNGLSIGIHVRRGDCHPLEFQYQKSYIPFEAYIHAAHQMIASTFDLSNSTSDNIDAITASKIIVASDDPDVYDAPELQPSLRAQSHIVLANGSTLDAAQGSSASSPSQKFVEGNVGWEGGFFSDVFWGLGGTASPSPRAKISKQEREPPSEMTLRLRELVGRAYLLDLKVIGSADRVVCGVSSVGCRLLAVMMGWEQGITGGKWRNVDGNFDWRAFD